jgi:hypothetical protein
VSVIFSASIPLFQDVLKLFNTFRANELLRTAADAAIVIGDGRAHTRHAPDEGLVSVILG